MHTMRRATAALLLATVTAFGLAACGSDDSGSDSGGGSKAPAEGKAGGSIKGVLTSSPDYMDPALSYTQEGWTLLWTAYTPLLTYKHVEGADGSVLIPGLAEALPEVSSDGKTYTLKLRSGLKYSDGTAVKAADFEHTVKRVLNLESGGSSFYNGIIGAEDYVKKGKAEADIPGITTDDATGEITIKLKDRDGAFSYYLAMDFVGLVPSDTPFKNMTKSPPPGVGQFKVTKSVPNRQIVLEKNANFPKIPDVAPAKLDKVTIDIVKNQRKQIQDVVADKVDYVNDPPPADSLTLVDQKAKDRYEEYVTNSTYYVFLNAKVKPFDDIKVRQAVNYAVDKRALVKIFGGLLAPACNFLPPGMKGYEKVDPCPYGEPGGEPDLEKAKALIKEAGAEGAKVTVWGNDEDPSTPVTENIADTMNKIGLDAKPKIVEGSVYFQTIGNQETKAQAGFANWFQDFPHPANFMFLINGKSIQDTNNQNFGNTDDPEINKLIDDANKVPSIDDSAAEYAKADKLAVERGYIAAYGNRKLTKLVSSKIDFDTVIAHPVYNVDLTSMALK